MERGLFHERSHFENKFKLAGRFNKHHGKKLSNTLDLCEEIVMGHRRQNIENIDVLLSIIDVFNTDIALSMSMCKYRYKVSMSIFFRCF